MNIEPITDSVRERKIVKPSVSLEGGSSPVRNLELYLEAERANVPIAGESQISHRNPEMIELHHDSLPPNVVRAGQPDLS